MSVSRENVFLARKSLRIVRAEIVMLSFNGQILLKECLHYRGFHTDLVRVEEGQQRTCATQENGLITCSKSGAFCLLFCSYEQKRAGGDFVLSQNEVIARGGSNMNTQNRCRSLKFLSVTEGVWKEYEANAVCPTAYLPLLEVF